jgi:hypothetical protein
MFPLLSRYLIENWTEVLPGTPPPEKLSFVQIPGSRASTFLVLAEKKSGGDRRPQLVIKIPRSQAGEDYLRLEYQNLERLISRLSSLPRFLPAVPKPVSLCAIGGKTILILEGLPGSRLHSFPTRGLGALRRVCTWLTELQVATRTTATLSAEDVERNFLEPIRKFEKGSELTREAARYIGVLRERVRGMVGQTLTLTLTHGDFSVSNILLDPPGDGAAYDRATVSVIDWTKSLEAGLPVRDLFHLMTAYAKCLTPEASSGRITYSLSGPGAYARTVRAWLDDYCGAMDLPRWYQGLCIAFEYIYGATDHPWGIETARKARYLDNFETYVRGISDRHEDRPFALLPG